MKPYLIAASMIFAAVAVVALFIFVAEFTKGWGIVAMPIILIYFIIVSHLKDNKRHYGTYCWGIK